MKQIKYINYMKNNRERKSKYNENRRNNEIDNKEGK